MSHDDPAQAPRPRDVAPDVVATIPPTVCLRVTRACNARCGFCLAPPRGHGVSFESLQNRIVWLRDAGVLRVNISGGEPTIRNDLPQILAELQANALASAMTTNGILLSEDLLAQLRDAGTRVKVSVHGSAPVHDEMIGRRCYDVVDANVGRLLDAGVPTAVQTVVTHGHVGVVGQMVAYCLERGITKLRLLPFVPRGRGLQMADTYQLSDVEKRELKVTVADARRELAGRLDVRTLDLWVEEYVVMETDGQVQIQRQTDAADSTLAHVR